MKSNHYDEGNGDEEEEDHKHVSSGPKKSNILPLWGNDRTMNLNPLILTNIQSSHYFKVNLYELKTYHEVIDEIYYKVAHLEPWEKGSRKTAGQTGMCGGVRGVGAGGIVSTAYCLLYKLFTLKLTRKQLNGLITHPDSPYIRALGFMYIRYTQPPGDLWDWYDEYLEDPEQKIEKNMNARYPNGFAQKPREPEPEARVRDRDAEFRRAVERDRSRFLDDSSRRPERVSPDRRRRSEERPREERRGRVGGGGVGREEERKREERRRSPERRRRVEGSHHRHRHRSRSRHRHRH